MARRASRRVWAAVAALVVVAATAAGFYVNRDSRRTPTPEGVERLMAQERFDAAALMARQLVDRRLNDVGAANPLSQSAWDPLLKACTEAVKLGNSRCVDWASDAASKMNRAGLGGQELASIRPFLVQLAELLARAHRLSEAEAAYAKAVAFEEHRRGPGRELVRLLNRQGEFYRVAFNDPAASRRIYDRSLAMSESLFGAESFEVAAALHNLAIVVADLEGYQQALSLESRAVGIMEKLVPADDLRLATLRDFNAVLLSNLGELTAARELHERVLEVRENKLGPDASAVAATLTNLSVVFGNLGDDQRALDVAERALAIFERTLGEHPNTAEAAMNVADIHARNGGLDAAARDYERALEILRAIRPAGDSAIGKVIQLLGHLDLAAGRLPEADRRFASAVAILRHDPQAQSRSLASALEGQGIAALRTKRVAAAAAPLEEAMSLRRERYGARHPKVAASGVLLAAQRRAAGDEATALDLALGAEVLSRTEFTILLGALGEREALRYAAHRPSGLGVALAVVASGGRPDDVARVWTEVIRSRAVVLDDMARRQRVVASRGAPELDALDRLLAEARQELAGLVLRSLRGDLSAPLAERLRTRAGDVERLERETAYRGVGASPRALPDFVSVAARVPGDTALLAYTVYRDQVDGAGTRRYMAFVLPASTARPVAVDLGFADAIDAVVTEWRTLSAGSRPILAQDDTDRSERVRATGEALRRAVWDPVTSALGTATRVLVIPDGLLHLFSFAALPTTPGHFLLEEDRVIHYLSTERDLIDGGSGPPRPRRLLAVGGPDFDAAPVPPAGSASIEKVGDVFRGGDADCLGKLRFEPLPRAAEEARGIARLWGATHGAASATLLIGRAAAERAVKARSHAPDLVHFATHAFFLDERCGAAAPGVVPYGSAARGPLPTPPLLLAGLALTGANRIGASAPPGNDGLLTSAEIASWDLSRTPWVVLSACDTGGGSIQDGEGVLGIRRAFQAAGARTLVMSLWRVGDADTMQWMARFYTHLLAGEGATMATRAASLDGLAWQRANGRSPDPTVWGAFVATGDWR